MDLPPSVENMNSSFSSRVEIDQIPETPQRGGRHRRAHSATFFRLPDDLLFDVSDIDNFSFPAVDAIIPAASPSDISVPMAVDSSRSDESSSAGPTGHFRSLSMESNFFDGLSFEVAADAGDGGASVAAAVATVVGEKKVGRIHRHSKSMDWGLTALFDADSGIVDGVKKAMPPGKLAELSLIDPKRAKRILANRQSAARSKERKLRYTTELERKVQTLQTEATSLSAKVAILQRDRTGLAAENRELKLRLQALEQQAQLRDDLHKALREEVQRLRVATGKSPSGTGNAAIRGLPLQFSLPVQGGNTKQTERQQQVHLTLPSPASDLWNLNRKIRPEFLGLSDRVQ
ncbi:hypothetical protein Dimus_005487 [Dionaea muscipula]